MAGYQIPNWREHQQAMQAAAGSAGHSSSAPVNTGFANSLINAIRPLMNPGAQDALANQQWQVARDNTINEIGNSNQHMAEQWAARTGRSLNGGGGVSVRAELDKQRLDPALAALEQQRIGQQMQQRNMLAGFAPALLAMNQRQAEFAYQQHQDELNRQAAERARQQSMTPPMNTRPMNNHYNEIFGTGQPGTGSISGNPGFSSGGGGDATGWGDGFGKLGSERGLWNAPKTDFRVWTSPSSIKPSVANKVGPQATGFGAQIASMMTPPRQVQK